MYLTMNKLNKKLFHLGINLFTVTAVETGQSLKIIISYNRIAYNIVPSSTENSYPSAIISRISAYTDFQQKH